MGEGSECGEEGGKIFRFETMLGLFGRELDLDEDGESFSEGGGSVVEASRGFEGVDGIDGVKEFGSFGGLVVLQRAD